MGYSETPAHLIAYDDEDIHEGLMKFGIAVDRPVLNASELEPVDEKPETE